MNVCLSAVPHCTLTSTAKVNRPVNIAKTVTHAGGREEANQVKPVHRKGLKGKKSDRALVRMHLPHIHPTC